MVQTGVLLPEISQDDLEDLIRNEYPYPVAVNYRRLLEAVSWKEKTERCINLFYFAVRAVTIGLLSQYLIRDVDKVNNPEFDRNLSRDLLSPSHGQWVEFMFQILNAYEGKRKLFFMPELYDLYWDSAQTPPVARKIRAPFTKLVEIRNEISHRLPPDSEAGWEILGREALDCLNAILKEFSFLKHYDLIRVIRQQDQAYEYERYTGEQISSHTGTLKSSKKLHTGWFYLLRKDHSVLLLHPLLIFFSKEMGIEQYLERGQDAAIFNRFLAESVEYDATVIWQTFKEDDADVLAKFRELIFYNLERVKLAPKHQARAISWEGLRRSIAEISSQQMGAVQGKYSRQLYLQRTETFQRLQDFLRSDKTCFVLTGKSGVGKSNFILSLIDEFTDRHDIGLLLYNGAQAEAGQPLVKTLSADLAKHFLLKDMQDKDLFHQLHIMGLMQGRTLLVIFDAINENANPAGLLKRIDQLMGDAPYPWLKLMVTSRPQAWRTMKQGLPLSDDRYYKPTGSDERWVEMEEFVVQLEDFRRDELHAVYSKYQSHYQFSPDYERLNPQIRETLRDPFILRLVSEIYQQRAIPEQMRISDIYELYLTELIRTGRLFERDLYFLEDELLPLMISPTGLGNKITRAQIDQAKTSDGRHLWELVHNEDMLRSGESVNAPYTRLCDTEMIIQQGPIRSYEISFKYERFYDYFAGLRIRRLFKDKTDASLRASAYREVIKTIRERPYLWGAVQTALLEDLKDQQCDSAAELLALAQTIDQLTRDMIVSVLTIHGRESRSRVETICHNLLKLDGSERKAESSIDELEIPEVVDSSDKHGTTDLVTRYLKLTASSQVQMAKKAAIEVAYKLSLTPILKAAAGDKDSAIRAVVAQYIYYLWREDQETAFRVLEDINNRIRGKWFIPDTKALQVCVGVSLMILFFHFGEIDRRREFLGRLQSMWKQTLGHLLFIGERDRGLKGKLKGLLREGLIYLGVRIVIATAGQAEESGVMFSLPELKHFFPPTEQHIAMFNRLIPQVATVHDPHAPCLTEVKEVLHAGMQDRDLLTTYANFAALLSNVIGRPAESLPIIRELFAEGLDHPPPNKFEGAPPAAPMMAILVWAVRNLIYGDRYTSQQLKKEDIPGEALEVYGDFIWQFEQRYGSWCSTDLCKYRVIEASSYTYFYYLLYDEVESALLNNLIDKAIQERDLNTLIYLLVGLSAIGSHQAWRGAKPAAQSLRLIMIKLKGTGLQEKLSGPLILAFSNLRAYHPYTVDDVLAELTEEQMPAKIKRAIQARGASESLGLLLGTAGAWFARDLLVDPDPQARDLLAWILAQATTSRSLSQWTRKLLKRIVNFMYSEPVFRNIG